MDLSPEIAKPTTDLATIAAGIGAITSPEELEGANELLIDIKAMQKQIEAFMDPHIKRAYEAHKALTVDRAKFIQPLLLAEQTVKVASQKYIAAERQKAEIERQRQENIARKAEIVRREEEARTRMEEAARLKKAGDAEGAKAVKAEAAAIVSAPVHVVVAAAPVAVPKGMTTTVRWKAEIVDFSLVPDELKLLNEKEANRRAAALKERWVCPGLKAVPVDGIMSRSS